jgi:hypothetical protein
MMELMPTTVFAKSATSSAQLVWEVPPTVSHALPTKFFIRVDAGPHAPPFCSPALELEALPALIAALMDSTKFPTPSAPPALLNAQLVLMDLTTVPHACKDQSPSMDLALLLAVRTNSASKEFALLAQSHAMVAPFHQPTAKHVPQDTSNQDQSVKRDVKMPNSMTPTKRFASTAPATAPHAQLTTTVLAALMLPSPPEEEFAPTAHTPAKPVMELELALAA